MLAKHQGGILADPSHPEAPEQRPPSDRFLRRSFDDLINPAWFRDPVAIKTSWKPLRWGSADFKDRTLLRVRPTRLEFRPNAAFFTSLFILSVLLIFCPLSIAFVDMLTPDPPSFASLPSPPRSTGEILLTIEPLILGALGWYAFHGTRPIVFDKDVGRSWRCWKPRLRGQEISRCSEEIPLDRIHALQIIPKISYRLIGRPNMFLSLELNLVLRDGQRMNVLNHKSIDLALSEAETLADFLGVPLWDAARILAQHGMLYD